MPELTRPHSNEDPSASVAESVFLSPRVLDRGAFEEYAARLRGLLEQVAAQGLALRSASADAERLVASLRAQFAERSDALESATRLAQSMNARVAEAKEMLGKAGDLTALAADFEARTQRIIDEKFASVERRFSEIIERFGKATQERVQHAASSAAAAAEQARVEREETRRLIESVARPATEALAAQIRRAETLASEGPDGLASIAALAERLTQESSRAELNVVSLRAISDTAGQSVMGLQASLDATVEFSDRLIAQNALAGQEIGAAVATCEQARAQIAQIAQDCRALAEPLLDAEQRAGAAAERAERILSRVEESREGGRQVVLELGETMNRLYQALDALEPWRPVLLEGSEGDLPAPLAEMVRGVRAEMSRDLAVIAAAMTHVAQRAAGDGPFAPASKAHGEPEVVIRVTEQPLRLSEA